MALRHPPADFNRLSLAIVDLLPNALCRVSRFATGEPFYGRSGMCRFDDNQLDADTRFGTCYLGLNLAVAFAESVLHNEEQSNGRFFIPASEVDGRFVLSFHGEQTLRLANMTGRHLLQVGANGELSGTPDYTLPQAWAAAVLAHPSRVDGMVYMSRRIRTYPGRQESLLTRLAGACGVARRCVASHAASSRLACAHHASS